MSCLIISSDSDSTTDEVIDWLDFFGQKFIRLGINEIFKQKNFSLLISNDRSRLTIHFENRSVEVKSIWYRKDSLYQSDCDHSFFDKDTSDIVHLFENHIEKEFNELKRGTFSSSTLNQIIWLNSYNKVNKIEVIAKANKIGLRTPETLITNNKDELQSFLEKNNRIICKAISDSFAFYSRKHGTYFEYTSEINSSDLHRLPKRFFPSLFQQLIPKQYDIRVVFLDNLFFSAAIFSQQTVETSIDFRNYNNEMRNRTVPFNLTKNQERKIRKLMQNLGMNFACIDLLMGEDSEIYFLEINPLGNFGSMSLLCNFYIEKEIAKFLSSHGEKEYCTTP